MSTISDALRTEVLYCDGNPDYIVPVSALSFMTEAADVLEAQEAVIEGIMEDLDTALNCCEWGEIQRLLDRLVLSKAPSIK